MSVFLGQEQQSAFKTLSTWEWDLSESRNEVNAVRPPLPAFTFVSKIDESESTVDHDEPTIEFPRLNHAQLPSEAFEIVLAAIQQAAPSLGERFRRAAQVVVMQKAAEAMLISKTPAPPLTRSAATSGATTPGFGFGMQIDGHPIKPPKKKPGPKPKPYARTNPDGTVTLEPGPVLTVGETNFRKSQHISPKSFVLIRDAYLNYWSGFQAHKRSYTTEEIVPDYPPLDKIGEEGSTERKFRLAVGLYLAREGKIPTHLVDGQRDNPGAGEPPKKRGRPKKGRPFGFGRKVLDVSDAVSGTATPTEPTSAESNASGEESSRPGSLAPRGSSQVSDATSSYYNSPVPYFPHPPAFHHQPHSFGSTVDHLTLSSRPTSVEPSTRPMTSSHLQHTYIPDPHPSYPTPLSDAAYPLDPPSAQV